jgi:hypothetical protein
MNNTEYDRIKSISISTEDNTILDYKSVCDTGVLKTPLLIWCFSASIN